MRICVRNTNNGGSKSTIGEGSMASVWYLVRGTARGAALGWCGLALYDWLHKRRAAR